MTIRVANSNDGLWVVAHRGVGAALLGFDLDEDKTDDFAGFAVERVAPDGTTRPLLNRLSFEKPITDATTPKQRRWTSTIDAPLQLFRWADIPPDPIAGDYTYRVTARYFTGTGTELRDGPTTAVSVPLKVDDFANFKLGFTRGYLSSQAYADKFVDANGKPLDFRVRPKTLDYDTAPFEAQYEWLGYTGRKILFEFLDACVADTTCTVDLFAYDLDEPDILRKLQALGPRLRAVVDDSTGHSGHALEVTARARLRASAGTDNVKALKFSRFAHSKVLIRKDATGAAVSVLAGSANFQVRGLYAQANNVFVYDDAAVAALYEQAFTETFDNAASKKLTSDFAQSPIAAGWNDVTGTGMPTSSFSFAPHTGPDVSLARPADAIAHAQSSVLYAIMTLGGGRVAEEIDKLPTRDDIFSYGMLDKPDKSVVYTPGAPNGRVVPFDFLKANVPWPFKQEFGREINGGLGQIIHDKFVVVDFDTDHPAVFFGSSNLAGGGETANGDNLVTTSDPVVASAFGVEAVRLIDHFQFRAAMHNATKVEPLILHTGKWYRDFYDDTNLRSTERKFFARAAHA